MNHDGNAASARFSDLLPSFAPPPQHPFDPALLPPLLRNGKIIVLTVVQAVQSTQI
jgi:hypothetical protein